MSSSPSNTRILSWLLLPVLLIALSAVFAGCGEDEPEPETPATAVPGVPESPAAPVDKPVAVDKGRPSADMGEVVPVTLSVLQFMPQEAQIALAIPPVPGLLQELEPLLKAFAPPEADIDAEISEFFAELGQELGVEADSFASLAAALGVDEQTPIAVFTDFSGVVASAQAAKTAAEAEAAKKKDLPLLDDGGALVETPDLRGLKEEEPVNYMNEADDPAWVAVLKLSDPDRAVEQLQRIAAGHEALGVLPPGEEDVAGVTLATRGDYGYFTSDGYLAVGHLALLRKTAERVDDPASFRYGTTEAPAATEDEIVSLIYGGRLKPLLEEAMPLYGQDEALAPVASAQFEVYGDVFPEENDDPIIGTLSITDEHVETLWRIDAETHPGLQELIGPIMPLRLARYLPESTLALLSFRFNEERKAQFVNGIVPAVAASGDASAAGNLVMASQFLTQLGDEVTIGVGPAQEGFPETYIMIGLADPGTTQGIVQMVLPVSPVDDYEGATINLLETPLKMPVYLSFVDDFVVASNSETGIKSLIGRYKAKEVSGLFASMEPPFDIERPRYQLAIIDTGIVESVSATLGAERLPEESRLAPLVAAIRQIRASEEQVDGWLMGRLTIYLGDLAQAAELRATAAEASAGESPDGETTTEEGPEGAPAPQ